jgi:Cysteine rich repeat
MPGTNPAMTALFFQRRAGFPASHGLLSGPRFAPYRALTSTARRNLIALPADTRRNQMFKILLVFPFVLMASEAWAQQGHDACARDVSRFCRARMNDGDSVVLACLKQHRSRISRACDKVMTENGQ